MGCQMALKPDTFSHSRYTYEPNVDWYFYNILVRRSIYDLPPNHHIPHRVVLGVSNTDLPLGILVRQVLTSIYECWVLAWLIRNAVQL